MTVLHLIDSAGLYGAERVVLSLMRQIALKGAEPVLCSIGNHGSGTKEIETAAAQAGLRVFAPRMADGPNFVGARRILNFARGIGAKVLHSHGYKPNILFGAIPRSLRKIPLVTTLHGWTSDRGRKLQLYQWLDSRLLRAMDRVVLVSPGMREHPRLSGRSDVSFEVIPNGIPLEAPVPAHTKAEDWSGRWGHVFGTVGRLSPEKGQPILLEAFRHVRDELGDCGLVIIGEGPERSALEQQIGDAGLGDSVHLAGYVENSRACLASFDSFVLPSLSEGLPITLLEAMAARVPVVASEVGGVGEVLEGGAAGQLVQPGDVDGLARAMVEQVTERPRADARVERAATLLSERYSDERMAERYLSIYREIGGGR